MMPSLRNLKFRSRILRSRCWHRVLAANSPLTVRGVKAILDAAQTDPIARGLDHVALWNAAFLPSEDLMEAVGAFIQKRPPAFRGR